jgi:methionyl aminopeptidase
MSVNSKEEFMGMQKVSEVVAVVLREMKSYAKIGMTTKELDNYGGKLLACFGAKSAPKYTYEFPGFTCISLNHEIAHGIPSDKNVLKEGDLINIDVSAELNGFWSDNGTSFIIGRDVYGHKKLVDSSRNILINSISSIRPGMKISDFGKKIESQAKSNGLKVIKNLAGHGVGRALHEHPECILNCEDKNNNSRFKLNSVVAIETFISTKSSYAIELNDGWTLVGNNGGYVAQHEHTILITKTRSLILTVANGI